MTSAGRRIFISYIHADRVWKERLVKHFSVPQHLGLIDTWDDTWIDPGGEWADEIERAVADCSAAIFLISADSLTSRFILSREITVLLTRRERDGVPIFPLIVGDCPFEQVLPKPHRFSTTFQIALKISLS